MRILLSEMAPRLRAQLRRHLAREPWVTAVTADTPDPAYDDPGGEEPLESATARASTGDLAGAAGAAQADVLLIDWDLAAPLPLGLLESVKGARPALLVAALSARPGERAAAAAAGVDLFLLSDGTPADAAATLRDALGAR